MNISGVFNLPDKYAGDVSRLPSGIWVVQIYYDKEGDVSRIYAGKKDGFDSVPSNMVSCGNLYLAVPDFNRELLTDLRNYLSKNQPMGFASVYFNLDRHFRKMAEMMKVIGFPVDPIDYQEYIQKIQK